MRSFLRLLYDRSDDYIFHGGIYEQCPTIGWGGGGGGGGGGGRVE